MATDYFTLSCATSPQQSQTPSGLIRRLSGEKLDATTLDLRNSGDAAGSRDRVVGYGAFALTNSPAAA